MGFFRRLYEKGGGDLWYVRCRKCAHTRKAIEAGQIRLWACSCGAFKYLWCPNCHWYRWHALIKKESPPLTT